MVSVIGKTKPTAIDGRTWRSAQLKEIRSRLGCTHAESARFLAKHNGIVPEISPKVIEPERTFPEMSPADILQYSQMKKQELENRRKSLQDQLEAVENDIRAWDRHITAGEGS